MNERPLNIELFSCSGGMAEGFRRAGIEFDFVSDYDLDACTSYEQNLKHRPVRMDVRDLVRMAKGGWRPGPIGLLVADPPCTPWSRAGKRLGTDDERDMLEETAELITLLRPRAYLIGNVPGLQDSTSWHVVQRVIGGLGKHGYCVADYVSLDAADYGVPQHRIRPFWYGHLDGPCARWPAPSHGDAAHPALPGLALKPWVTCRAALAHLPLEELGRPVRPKRADPKHPGCEADAPAMTVKATDGGGNALPHLVENEKHPVCEPDGLAPTLRGGDEGHSAPQVVLANDRHAPSRPDEPSGTIGAKYRGQHEVLEGWPWDRPATTVLADDRLAPPGTHDRNGSILTPPELRGSRKKYRQSPSGPQSSRVHDPDGLSPTVQSREDRIGTGSVTLDWPWDRPGTTVCAGIDKIAPASEHAGQFGPNAVVLSERAAAILQGFPETWCFSGATKKARWAQIGMAMPPPLAEAVARAIRAALEHGKAKVGT